MKGYKNALYTEILKARRSRVFIFSALAFSLIPLFCGLFMLILKNPGFAQRIGLLGAKAQLAAGSADWPSYLGVISQATAIAGIFLFSLIAIWVFGREYSDRTLKDILSLPTSRTEIVAAKFTLVAVWSIVVSLLVGVVSYLIGAAVSIPKWSSQTAWGGASDIAVTAVLTMVLILPVAFVASAGRGYIPPVAYTILTLVMGMIFAATGWGKYIPWTVPALYSGAAGSEGPEPVALSYVLVVLIGIAGIAATLYWWRHADQTR